MVPAVGKNGLGILAAIIIKNQNQNQIITFI
jgi:hypothetical protein